MNVNTIKSLMNGMGGPALPCQFIVNVIPPLGVLTGGLFEASDLPTSSMAAAAIKTGAAVVSTAISRPLSILARAAELPGRQFDTTPHRIFGTTRMMPYGVSYKNVMVTFMCTNSMLERTFFDFWHQQIMSPTSQYMSYYEDYVGTVVIQKLDNSYAPQSIVGDVFSTYVLEEAYPVSIQGQELDYQSKNSVLELTVEFSFARWKNTIDYIDGIGSFFPPVVTVGDTQVSPALPVPRLP